MESLSPEFVRRCPECLRAKRSIDLMLLLGENDRITNLKDLLTFTSYAEGQLSRLKQMRMRGL